MLRGGAKAGWDLSLDAAGGPIRIEGGLDPAGRSIEKTGPFPLEIKGGAPAAPARFAYRAGGLVLDGADLALPFATVGWRERASEPDSPGVALRNGATLRLTNNVGALWFRAPLSLGDPAEPSDPSTLVGNGRRLTFAFPPRLAPGSCITNAGTVLFGFHPTSDIPRTIRVPAGARLYGDGLWLGGNPDLPGPVLDRVGHDGIRFLVEGPAVPEGGGRAKLSGPPTVIDIKDGGRFNVGGFFDTCRSSNVVAKIDGAVVFRVTGNVAVPCGPWRSDGNRLSVGRGVHLDARELCVGEASASNRITLAACTVTTGAGLYVGYGSDRTGVCLDNRLELRDGARLAADGPLCVGRGRRSDDTKESFARGNAVVVRGKSRLATKGAEIGWGQYRGPVHDSVVTLEGDGTRWDLGGRTLAVGGGYGAPVSNSVVKLSPGTLLTNANEIVVGAANASTVRGSRLTVAGARVFTTGNVWVGRAQGGDREYEALDNAVVVAGHDGKGAAWDFGGGALRVGFSSGWRHMLRRNRFELRPGARLRNLGTLFVGGGSEEAVFTEEAVLELRGGVLEPVKNLRLGQGGVLAFAVDPRLGSLGTTPIEALESVEVKKGAAIRPVAAKGARPRLYPILRWKGEGKGLENLALAPGVDADRWKLHVDAEKKQVLLQLVK